MEASVGHVRDLPQGAAQIPAKYKGEKWASLGVNVENDFEPLYVVSPGKSKQIKLLKDQLKNADALYLATDEDREGEAISWHLLELLKPKVPVHRLVFTRSPRTPSKRRSSRLARSTTALVKAQETAAHPRPPVRVRGLAVAVAEGPAEALCGARAERRGADDR